MGKTNTEKQRSKQNDINRRDERHVTVAVFNPTWALIKHFIAFNAHAVYFDSSAALIDPGFKRAQDGHA